MYMYLIYPVDEQSNKRHRKVLNKGLRLKRTTLCSVPAKKKPLQFSQRKTPSGKGFIDVYFDYVLIYQQRAALVLPISYPVMHSYNCTEALRFPFYFTELG